MDAPKLNHEGQAEPFSFEASEYARDRVYNKAALLVFDWRLRDQYGRVLAYVYLPEGGCLNAELLEQGCVRLYSGEECQFTEEFRLLEQTARQTQVGLWAEQQKTVFIAEIHNAGYEEHLEQQRRCRLPVLRRKRAGGCLPLLKPEILACIIPTYFPFPLVSFPSMSCWHWTVILAPHRFFAILPGSDGERRISS